MPARFIHLETVDGLEELFTASHRRPVVIFKHSSTCGISAGVIREVESLETDVNIVTVQRSRELSNAIALRTGIRHESPQAIVLACGEPVYFASHYDITQEDIEAHLAAPFSSVAAS